MAFPYVGDVLEWVMARTVKPDRIASHKRRMRILFVSMSRNRIWLGGMIVLALALAYNFVGLATTPPGLDRDAAANGLMALNWLRDGLAPFWMPHASAPEPWIVWLQTATTALLGPSVAALRSASALFLSLAAVIVYLLTLTVAKPFQVGQRWWAALLAGIVFACNPVVTQVARTGLRASTLPFFSGLFFLLLLRAWRTNSRRDYLISGLALGCAAYTYLAARFLPIVVVIFVAWAWWREVRRQDDTAMQHASFRPQGGIPSSEVEAAKRDFSSQTPRNDVTRWVGLLLMVAAAFVVVLPQLIFFAQYPNAFLERAQSVSLFSNPAFAEVGLVGLLAEKVWAMLGMFGVAWSGQYNQAARPLLLPLPFVGALLALPLLWRWRRQAAMQLMVVAWAIMLLPDLIGGDRLQPHELRVIGAYVPTMVLSGIGLAFGLGWIVRLIARWRQAKWAWNVAGALLALLVAGWGVVDWFGVATPTLAQSDYAWFARPDVRFAESINRHTEPMIVPLNDYSRSVVAYLSAQRITQLRSGIDAAGQTVQPSSPRVLLLWPHEPERARVESTSYRFDPHSLVLIDGDRAYLMPPARGDVAQLQSTCAAQPIVTETGEGSGALCAVDFAAFDFPAEFPADLSGPTWRVGDLYGELDDEELRLRGINADRAVLAAGSELGITSFWRAERRTHDRWRYFVHLLDDRQVLVAGDDLIPGYGVYGARLWQTDEFVPIRQVVTLPDALAPGRYWIEVGLYDPLDYDRAVVDGTAADHSVVGPLKVPLAESPEVADAISLAAQFGDELALDVYNITHNDAGLAVTLRLSALRQPEHDYTVFVHVENGAGEIVAQNDAQPRDGLYPTAIWDAGEAVVSTWQVTLPTPLAPGSYRLWMGIYEWQRGVRLPIQAEDATVAADRLLLKEIDLQ